MSRMKNESKLTKGEKIKMIREELGLNQADLAKLAGVSVNTVSGWETGEHEPSNHHWRAISQVFNLQGETSEEFQLACVDNLELCPGCKEKVRQSIVRWNRIRNREK